MVTRKISMSLKQIRNKYKSLSGATLIPETFVNQSEGKQLESTESGLI